MSVLLIRLLLPLLLSLLGGTLFSFANIEVADPDAVTPPELRNGWTPPSEEDQLQISQDTVPFFIAERPNWASSAGAQVYLWEFAKQVNGGEHLPTFYQQTGDCVSMGAANGVNYLQATQIAVHGLIHEFRPAYQPWIYGVSRTAVDLGNKRLGRSAGSVGGWAVGALKLYGMLPADTEGLPAYSGKIANEWGFKGPPSQWFDKAAESKLLSYAKVSSYEDVRDAIANGYPVTVASNRGFQMKQKLSGGKMVGIPSGTWNHQMCFIGVDDVSGHVYCLNSWGANAHSTPANGEPPGGFWVDKRTVNQMVSQGDSYALSLFEGFPYRPLDFQTFTSSLPPGTDVIDIPDQTPVVPLCQSFGCHRRVAQCGGEILMFGAGFAGIAAYAKGRRRKTISPTTTA